MARGGLGSPEEKAIKLAFGRGSFEQFAVYVPEEGFNHPHVNLGAICMGHLPHRFSHFAVSLTGAVVALRTVLLRVNSHPASFSDSDVSDAASSPWPNASFENLHHVALILRSMQVECCNQSQQAPIVWLSKPHALCFMAVLFYLAA